jgi:hypothetical protein
VVAVVLVVLLAAAVAVTIAARTRPSFDAYGWLDWGRMTLHGGLNTNAAPSWKPLPWLFTVVFGLFGRGAELWLWMGTVTFLSFAGLVWAGRLAWALALAPALGGNLQAADPNADAGKVVRAGAEEPSPHRSGTSRAARSRLAVAGGGAVAAPLAVLVLLAVHDQYPFGYLHYVLSSQSDPMVVAFVLGAADCRRRDRPGGAFCLLVTAALGRPEAWPFLLAAAAWLWRARPGARWAVVAGLAVVAALWFGVPALSSRSWFVAADNASASGYAPQGDALHRGITVLARLVFQLPWAIWAAAAGAVTVALWRRERTALWLAGAALAWIAVEVGFGIHGWPALGRYMFEPAAVVIVLGASFVGRLVGGGLVMPGAAGAGDRAAGARAAGAGAQAAGVGRVGAPASGVGSSARGPASALRDATGAQVALGLVGLGLIVWTVPSLVDAGRREARDLRAQHVRTAQLDALVRTIDRLGGPGLLRRCGEVISAGPGPGTVRHRSVGLGGQTPLAFDVGENVNRVGYIYPQPGHPRNPIVVFHPNPDDEGWTVRALRQTAPGCKGLGARSR